MNTLNHMVAIAAASTLILASCNHRSKLPEETEIEDILEKNSVTVSHNALTDTMLTIGGTQMRFAEVSRIFQADSTDQFYLSVRAIVPADSSEITNRLYHRILGYYQELGDTLAQAPAEASTPVGLARALDDVGRQFKIYVQPYVADTLTSGFMMNADMRPVYGTDRYITYAVYDDYYTGGAHGEIDSYFTTFDLATGVPYTFDTLFGKPAQKKLRAMIVDIIAKDKGLTPEEYLKSLNEFLMPATPVTVENFPVYHVGLTSMGVIFTYPKYTIAAGFEGCPSYVIPLDEVSAYLSL